MSADETAAGVEISPEARAAVERLLQPPATVFERVSKILGELPAIGKDSYNQQQQFHYRSHDDVLNALNPLLASYGVFVVPNVVERIAGTRPTRSGGVMYEVNLHVEFSFYGIGGDSFVASAWGEGTDSGDKATNKAMTQAFKYALAQVFAVSTADTIDADGQAPEETVREFDPGSMILDGAIQGEGFAQRLGDALSAIGPVTDWRATLAPILSARFHVETRQEIEAARIPEYWNRLSNAVAKIAAENDTTAFPPLDERPEGKTAIREALAWAFGVSPEIVVLVEREPTPEERQAAEDAATAAAGDYEPPSESAETTAAEEIPWVSEVKEAIEHREHHDPTDEPNGEKP